MRRRYVFYFVLFTGCCILCVGCYKCYVGYWPHCPCCAGAMWDILDSVWAVTSSMWDAVSSTKIVADTMWATCALCGLLYPLCGMLQSLCRLSQAPCWLLCPLCMLHRHNVGCCRRCVGHWLIYEGNRILHVCCTGAIWAVTSEDWERRQGMKKGRKERKRMKGRNR